MNDLLHALGIQWYALLAQIVNFAILVFVLTKFVYRPVLGVIDRRRKVIEDSLEKAKEIDRQKELVDQERAKILSKADKEAGDLLERAKTEAEAIRTEVQKEAKQQAAQIVAKGMQQLQTERARMVKDIQTRLAHAIVGSAEKILRREFSKEDQKNFEEELKKELPSLLS